MALLHVEGLTKSFRPARRSAGRGEPVRAVDGVSFTIEPGVTLALAGESGSGKSTTARLITRLIEPDGGSITYDGVDVRALARNDLRRLRMRVQMIFQDPYSSLDPRITVGDSIAEPLLIFRKELSAADRVERTVELLQRVGLRADDRARYPRHFSGGQLQRISIARALSLDPGLIICDEPVAALDMSVRAQVVNLMRDLQAERGIAYLMISHDLSLLRVIASEIVVMAAGRIVEQGSTAEVLESPAQPYTRTLVEAIPRIDSAIVRSRNGRSPAVGAAGAR